MLFAAPLLGAATWYLTIEAAGDLHELAGKALMLLALGHASWRWFTSSSCATEP